MLSPEDVSDFHAQGFVRVKAVFSAAELENIRVTNPLDGVWSDPRLVEIARTLLGVAPVFYFMTSFAVRHREEPNKFRHRHIHHDALGTRQNLFSRDHRPGVYPALRFGIYLQNFSANDQSGALKVSPGSHKIDTSSYDEYALPYVNVSTVPGDVIVFSKRLLHSGHALLQRARPDIVLSPCAENSILEYDPTLFLPPPAVRETLFIDYCARNETTDIHIKSVALNDNGVSELARRIGPELLKRAKDLGIELRVDIALIECCDAMVKEIKPNGRIGSGALPAVQEFQRLLPLAVEYSEFFPLWTGLKKGLEGCLQAIERIAVYRNMMATRTPDEHMMSSVDNNLLDHLKKLGARGEFGVIESVSQT